MTAYSTITTQGIQKAFTSAAKDNQRHRKVLVFVLKEAESEKLKVTVEQMLMQIMDDDKPEVKDCLRVGLTIEEPVD